MYLLDVPAATKMLFPGFPNGEYIDILYIFLSRGIKFFDLENALNPYILFPSIISGKHTFYSPFSVEQGICDSVGGSEVVEVVPPQAGGSLTKIEVLEGFLHVEHVNYATAQGEDNGWVLLIRVIR